MTGGGARRAQFADGRWHFQHGPIELIIGCDGRPEACAAAIEQVWQRFEGLLTELVGELALLRTDCRVLVAAGRAPCSPVARRMLLACMPYAQRFDLFITPMAAVAGAVADELIGLLMRPGIERAYINNGGDIALLLRGAARYEVGIVTDAAGPAARPPGAAPARAGIDASVTIDAASSVRGVATSGWRGRSLSLGIADSVTVLASSAARADAAATIIANHVDCDDPAVVRRPAAAVRDDSDLGELPVTVAVGALAPEAAAAALARGVDCARRAAALDLAEHAALSLAGQWRQVSRRHDGSVRLHR